MCFYSFYRGLIPPLPQNIIDPSIPYGLPYHGEIIRPFGMNEHPIFKKDLFHYGIDIQAPEGSSIRATADGIVIEAGRKGAYGDIIVIRHSDVYATLYAHCSELLVAEGDKVNRGQVIAKSGSTGIAMTPQIHYEVIKSVKSIDPIQHNEELRKKYFPKNSDSAEK